MILNDLDWSFVVRNTAEEQVFTSQFIFTFCALFASDIMIAMGLIGGVREWWFVGDLDGLDILSKGLVVIGG